MEAAGHILGVFQIKIGPPPELGNDKVAGVQQPKAEPRLFKMNRRTVSISGRHGNHRPPGHVLAKISRHLMVPKEMDKRVEVPCQFAVHVQGTAIRVTVSLQRKPPYQKEVHGRAGLPHVFDEQRSQAISRDRRQTGAPLQIPDSHVDRPGLSPEGEERGAVPTQ